MVINLKEKVINMVEVKGHSGTKQITNTYDYNISIFDYFDLKWT